MKNNTRLLRALVCGVAGLAMAAVAAAKDPTFNLTAGPVELQVAVSAVRIVPASNPLPGLHLDARLKGRLLDIYIAPMSFVTKYDLKVAKGDYLIVTGTVEDGVILAKNIQTGAYDKDKDVFHPEMTIFLRDENGPFWTEEAKPASE